PRLVTDARDRRRGVRAITVQPGSRFGSRLRNPVQVGREQPSTLPLVSSRLTARASPAVVIGLLCAAGGRYGTRVGCARQLRGSAVNLMKAGYPPESLRHSAGF